MIQHLWHPETREPLCGHATARPYPFATMAESNAVPLCTRCYRVSLHLRDRERYTSPLTPTRLWSYAYRIAAYWSVVFLTGCVGVIIAAVFQYPPMFWVGLAVMLLSVALNVYHDDSSPTDPRPGEAALGAALLIAGVAFGIGAGYFLAGVL